MKEPKSYNNNSQNCENALKSLFDLSVDSKSPIYHEDLEKRGGWGMVRRERHEKQKSQTGELFAK